MPEYDVPVVTVRRNDWPVLQNANEHGRALLAFRKMEETWTQYDMKTKEIQECLQEVGVTAIDFAYVNAAGDEIAGCLGQQCPEHEENSRDDDERKCTASTYTYVLFLTLTAGSGVRG